MSEFSIIFIDDNFNAMSTLVQTMSVEFPQADVSRIFNDPDKMLNMKIKARLLAKKNSTQDICKIVLA